MEQLIQWLTLNLVNPTVDPVSLTADFSRWNCGFNESNCWFSESNGWFSESNCWFQQVELLTRSNSRPILKSERCASYCAFSAASPFSVCGAAALSALLSTAASILIHSQQNTSISHTWSCRRCWNKTVSSFFFLFWHHLKIPAAFHIVKVNDEWSKIACNEIMLHELTLTVMNVFSSLVKLSFGDTMFLSDRDKILGFLKEIFGNG